MSAQPIESPSVAVASQPSGVGKYGLARLTGGL